jgi:hypothetical protein
MFYYDGMTCISISVTRLSVIIGKATTMAAGVSLIKFEPVEQML